MCSLNLVLHHEPDVVVVDCPVFEVRSRSCFWLPDLPPILRAEQIPYLIPNVTYLRETYVTRLEESGEGRFVEVVVVGVGERMLQTTSIMV